MQRSLVLMSAVVVSTLLSTGTQVHADSIPWAYIATPSSTEINNNNNLLKTSTIQFNGASGSSSSEVGSGNLSGVILYNLTTTSTAGSPGDSFNSVPITLSATLTDLNATQPSSGTSVPSGAVTLTGHLTATNVTKTGNISPATITWDAPATASVVLGSDKSGWFKYTATPGNYVVPQPNNPNAPGSLQLLVSVTTADAPIGSGEIPIPPSAAPEPASLVLAGFGLPLFLLARRRLKKARVESTKI